MVGFLAAGELGVAVDQDDAVLARQAECILDGRITGADHHHGLAVELFGVAQRVLHAIKRFAGHAKHADVALQADGEHHMSAMVLLAVLAAHAEMILAQFLDMVDLATVADGDVLLLELGVPCAKHFLACAGTKTHATLQRQMRRFRHHMLAHLVFVDGVGGMRFGFQQHEGNHQLARARRRPSRPAGPDSPTCP